MTDNFFYILEKAAQRLQQQANNCRGTVCDDDKAYGLQLEADTIIAAIKMLRTKNSK